MTARRGYSLLELMIALSLLVGLLAAGWSMLATYRDAEQRGWKLVERTQLVRVSHGWLQNDLMQILTPESSTAVNTTDNSTSNPSAKLNQTGHTLARNRSANRSDNRLLLTGNSRGFTATIVPSIDPVPFFEAMLEGDRGEDTIGDRNYIGADAIQLSSERQTLRADVAERPIARPLWPPKNIQIEYELVQKSESLLGTAIVPVFDLVRRERVDRDQLPQSDQEGLRSTERVLSSEDLYRQNDELAGANLALLQENRLPGLTNAEFWYCDGAQWKRSWSGGNGRLPTAVALLFDFAPREHPKLSSSARSDFDSSPSDLLNNTTGLDQAATNVEETTLEGSMESFELLERDVRLIVRLEQHSLKLPIGPLAEPVKL